MLSIASLSEKPLGEEIDRAAFHCGIDPLDEYFKGARILDDVKSGVTSAYVLVNGDDDVLGYYTLSSAQVVRDQLSGSLQRKMKYDLVPATLIGRLAIQKELQGQKPSMGAVLLMRALAKAYYLAKEIASRIVVVDTIDDKARGFYMHFGFQKLSNDKEQYFFDLRRVPELAKKAGLLVE